MRRIVAIVLTVLSACTVSPVPTPPVTPAATATAFATIPPTQEPPYKLLHPARVAVSVANVVELWCYSKTTTIALFERSVEWHRDDAAYANCVSRGVLQ